MGLKGGLLFDNGSPRDTAPVVSRLFQPLCAVRPTYPIATATGAGWFRPRSGQPLGDTAGAVSPPPFAPRRSDKVPVRRRNAEGGFAALGPAGHLPHGLRAQA